MAPADLERGGGLGVFYKETQLPVGPERGAKSQWGAIF